MLANSSNYKINNGELMKGDSLDVQGSNLPLFLIGDSAYPLLSWLIKPFSFSSSLTSQQKLCNYRLLRARVVVEIAFSRLKARWRKLTKQIDMHVENVPNVIAACCVLHNICEVHQDSFNDAWLQEIETQVDQPAASSSVQSSSHAGGDQVRDILIKYF